MKISKHVTGIFQTNIYIIISEKNNAVIIDPGGDGALIVGELKKSGVKVQKILLTHGHFDHTKSCAEIQRLTDAKVYIHSDDAIKLVDKNFALPFRVPDDSFTPVYEYDTVSEGDIIEQDELKFLVIHTPGHTAGCVAYYIDDMLITGDTLFKGDIGATDDKSASYMSLLQSVDRLKQIEDDLIVLPGHGDETTLFYEKAHNKYMQ